MRADGGRPLISGNNEAIGKIEKGTLFNANFAQSKIRRDETFSPESAKKYSSLAGKPINTIDDLSNAIRDGSIHIKNLPVDYVYMSNGVKLILNTRTSVALDRAGIPKNQWYGINRTNEQVEGMGKGYTYNDLAREQLKRNKLPAEGYREIPKGSKND